MDIKKQILSSLGQFALQSMTHRHVFCTPNLKRFATTKSVGPVHGHKVYISGQWLNTDVVRSGENHRHKIFINGNPLLSGLPVDGMSTEYF